MAASVVAVVMTAPTSTNTRPARMRSQGRSISRSVSLNHADGGKLPSPLWIGISCESTSSAFLLSPRRVSPMIRKLVSNAPTDLADDRLQAKEVRAPIEMAGDANSNARTAAYNRLTHQNE